MAHLHTLFFGQSNVSEVEIKNAILIFINQSPFYLYIINFAWNYYAEAFNKRYPQWKGENQTLALANFVTNAARVSQVADVEPEGEHWQKTLKEAEKSQDLFVQISLTFYKLCNFQETEKNSKLLEAQLAQLKKEFPQYYELLGIQEKD